MEKIWLVVLKTEDSETYYYSYKEKPSVDQIKNDFFGEYGAVYPEEEWGMTISPKIKELTVR
jgi:hypothetical protein